jgi:hypothetical protein
VTNCSVGACETLDDGQDCELGVWTSRFASQLHDVSNGIPVDSVGGDEAMLCNQFLQLLYLDQGVILLAVHV